MEDAALRDSGAWLAQYDFRMKQKYIFRTNKLQEIVGASALITCMYDLFINACRANGIPVDQPYSFPQKLPGRDASGWRYQVSRFIELRYNNKEDQDFDPAFSNDTAGKVIYVGGGNLYILWRNKETALRANHILCDLLRREGYSLFPACGLTPCTGDYAEDIRSLSAAFNRSKEQLPAFEPLAVLPFTRFDGKSSFPVERLEGEEYLPRECILKRRVCNQRIVGLSVNDPLDLREFDEMRDKDTDSMLAVIHIDGNNMGERVSALMTPAQEENRRYPEAVKKIRKFSNTIQDEFVTKPLTEISAWLQHRQKRARIIVAGGDDVTLVCRAKDALGILEAYFDTLEKENAAHEGTNQEKLRAYSSACAGVCIFHAHAPFATAYGIAEACCEEAKKKNRQAGGKNNLVDFQYCFSGVTGDLQDIRQADQKWLARPYRFKQEVLDALEQGSPAAAQREGIHSLDALKAMNTAFQAIGGEDSNSQRSVLKRLSSLLLTGKETEFDLEIERLKAAYPAFQPRAGKAAFKQLVFDLAQVYDLWFNEEEK